MLWVHGAPVSAAFLSHDHGTCHVPPAVHGLPQTLKKSTGWWLSHPSEKYYCSQWEGLSHILWKIKNVWNHQPVNCVMDAMKSNYRFCCWETSDKMKTKPPPVSLPCPSISIHLIPSVFHEYLFPSISSSFPYFFMSSAFCSMFFSLFFPREIVKSSSNLIRLKKPKVGKSCVLLIQWFSPSRYIQIACKKLAKITSLFHWTLDPPTGESPSPEMGQNPGTFCSPQVIAGIHGCSSPNKLYL